MSQETKGMSKKEFRRILIEEAQRLVAENDGNPISRDYFRSSSQYKDRWSACFTTFNEFMLAAKLPTISKPPTPELPIEKQVEIEREKLRANSEGWKGKFTHLSREYETLESKLKTVMDLTSRAPQILNIPPKLQSGKSESVAILVTSDWHSEESVMPDDVSGVNFFNLKECEARAIKFFQGGQRLWEITNRDTSIKTLVLALLGDFINNTIHEDAQESNNLLPGEAIWFAQNLIYNGIKFLLKETNVTELIIPCHVGNHGRLTKKQRNGSVEAGNSLEHYMYRNLQELLKDEPRVRFQIAGGYHSYLNLFGTFPIRFHHGHAVKYWGGSGGITIPLNKSIDSWNKNKHVKLDILGHFHQHLDGGNFIVNGSLVGYNAFAVSIKAAYERPMQMFLLVNKKYNEKTIVAPIFVTDNAS